jgi:dual specificity protein kinase YAK1
MPRRLLTEPGEGLHNDGHDNVNSDYIFYMYDEIRNEKKEEYHIALDFRDYVVEDLIGKGTFGQVLLCRNDGRRVAVKVVRNRPAYQSQAVIEFQILKEINKA